MTLFWIGVISGLAMLVILWRKMANHENLQAVLAIVVTWAVLFFGVLSIPQIIPSPLNIGLAILITTGAVIFADIYFAYRLITKSTTVPQQPNLGIEKLPAIHYEDSTIHRVAVSNNGILAAESCECKLALDWTTDDVISVPAIIVQPPYHPPEEMNLSWVKKPDATEIPIKGKSTEIIEMLRVTKPYREFVGDPTKLAIRNMFGRDDDSDYITKPATFEIQPFRLKLRARTYEGSIKVQCMNCPSVTRRLKIQFNGKDNVDMELQ